MNIITHNLNGLSVGLRSSDGYVNATSLCKAGGKFLADYLRLETTNTYLEALSVNMGFSIKELIEKRRGVDTWVHPEVAIDLAKWISVEFRISVNRWVYEWMMTGRNPIQQPQSNVSDEIALIDFIYKGMAERTTVEPNLVEMARLSAIESHFPKMAPAVAAAKNLLAQSTPVQEHLLSPTDLGKLLGDRLGLDKPVSAVKVNEALKDSGMQVAEHISDKKGKKKLIWHLTETGKQYGRRLLDSARGHDKTIEVVRWLPEVLNVIHSGSIKA